MGRAQITIRQRKVFPIRKLALDSAYFPRSWRAAPRGPAEIDFRARTHFAGDARTVRACRPSSIKSRACARRKARRDSFAQVAPTCSVAGQILPQILVVRDEIEVVASRDNVRDLSAASCKAGMVPKNCPIESGWISGRPPAGFDGECAAAFHRRARGLNVNTKGAA